MVKTYAVITHIHYINKKTSEIIEENARAACVVNAQEKIFSLLIEYIMCN